MVVQMVLRQVGKYRSVELIRSSSFLVYSNGCDFDDRVLDGFAAHLRKELLEV